MQWFKNLNATPRLMLSFDVLMVVTMDHGNLLPGHLSLEPSERAHVRF
jgi:hypothetical protein